MSGVLCSKTAYLAYRLPCVANTEAGHLEKPRLWNATAGTLGFFSRLRGRILERNDASGGPSLLSPLLVKTAGRDLDEGKFIQSRIKIASAEKLDIYHLSPPLRKSPPSLLRHLCPSAVAIVLQWEAAVALHGGQAWWKAVSSFFFFSPFYSITAHLGPW